MRKAIALALLTAVTATAAAEEQGVVFRERGEASFYGDEFQGRPTASGERFDQAKPTAAHPELPLGSAVTVTNPETNRTVEVEINDRGPYADDRVLDVSKSTARKLGMIEDGVAEVRVEATEGQVEQAIEAPDDASAVEKDLIAARRKAAAEGTPQPGPAPDLAR